MDDAKRMHAFCVPLLKTNQDNKRIERIDNFIFHSSFVEPENQNYETKRSIYIWKI
jgi:hypothetical protein